MTTIEIVNPPPEDQLAPSAEGFGFWIDTNVMLDVSTDYQAVKNAGGGEHAVEETRMVMQRAHWLGVALDQERARTMSFRHEATSNLAKYAAPGTDGASFVAAFAWIVKDHVFPSWDAHMTMRGMTAREGGVERPTTNDERDQFMVDEAKAHGLIVITRDKGAKKRALAAGVPVFKPEEYACRVISFDAARERFFERAETGVLDWLKRNGNTPHNQRAIEVLWTIYNVLWSPAGAFTRPATGT